VETFGDRDCLQSVTLPYSEIVGEADRERVHVDGLEQEADDADEIEGCLSMTLVYATL